MPERKEAPAAQGAPAMARLRAVPAAAPGYRPVEALLLPPPEPGRWTSMGHWTCIPASGPAAVAAATAATARAVLWMAATEEIRALRLPAERAERYLSQPRAGRFLSGRFWPRAETAVLPATAAQVGTARQGARA